MMMLMLIVSVMEGMMMMMLMLIVSVMEGMMRVVMMTTGGIDHVGGFFGAL